MNRSWTQLRRALLAFSFVGAMGFGATQAFATPEAATFAGCSLDGVQVSDCTAACKARGYDVGYCALGRCVCRVYV